MDHASELAGLQHQSAKLLSEMLEDSVEIYPTHGFGSFCSATPTIADSSTMEDEKRSNPVLLLDKERYIEMTLKSLDVYPTYFKFMSPINTAGALAVDLSELAHASSDEIVKAINSGAWIVDLRNREVWANEHVLGSTSLGLDGSLASYLGWLYPYEKELFLISDSEGDISKAQRELVRIGIDRPTASYVGPLSPFNPTASIRVARFSDLADAMGNSQITLLDVRQVLERKKSHLDSSIFIPFYEVESRVNELPESQDIWVHCASGYRATSVLRFIETSGRIPVLIDEDYEKASAVAGLSIISNDS